MLPAILDKEQQVGCSCSLLVLLLATMPCQAACLAPNVVLLIASGL